MPLRQDQARAVEAVLGKLTPRRSRRRPEEPLDFEAPGTDGMSRAPFLDAKVLPW